jgi:hypothetical protein
MFSSIFAYKKKIKIFISSLHHKSLTPHVSNLWWSCRVIHRGGIKIKIYCIRISFCIINRKSQKDQSPHPVKVLSIYESILSNKISQLLNSWPLTSCHNKASSFWCSCWSIFCRMSLWVSLFSGRRYTLLE